MADLAEQAGRLYDFMIKREHLRLVKEAGRSPWPWSDDDILNTYKFTNVKRAHDKTTRLLVEEFYVPGLNDAPEIALLNCAMFRYFGTIEFARAVGWQEDFYPEHIKRVAKDRLAAGARVFTGAYVITNQGIKAPKQDVVVDIFLKGIWENSSLLAQNAKDRKWRNVARQMQTIKGFGGTGFMTKEVLLDTMFTSFWPGPVLDRDDWCPAGPGARRGINRLLGRDLKVSMKEEGALYYMREIFALRESFWPNDWVKLELHDIQFQLCEFDKYERVRLGQGRPRSKYHPVKPVKEEFTI